MSVIIPFRAVHPARGLYDKIAALPYDVYNRSEAKAVVSKNPMSFLKIDRAETSFDDSFDMYSTEVYEKARKLYDEMKASGEFVKEEAPCFYLYEQTMNGRVQTGLVCLASVDEYINNTIKKHENTRADKEEDRIRHVDTVNAQTGPIFLAYRSKPSFSEFVSSFKKNNSPEFDFVSEDGIRHRGFRIAENEDIAFVCNEFAEVPSLYIADGHHRCASAVKVCLKRREQGKIFGFSGFLSVIFPDDELMIMDYNRVVFDLKGYTEDSLVKKLSEKFDVQKIERTMNKPEKKGDIYMLFKESEYRLHLKDEFLPEGAVESLDVSVLQNFVLEPLFGIKDPRTDKNIDFVGGIRGVEELDARIKAGAGVAFSMYPTAMSELFRVADEGLLMPPKSTWFEPKLRSGLFINEL